ncbi:hypothetical protein [Flavobacterium chungangensis]|uniref:Antitoxin VbhA domain-containing protein n=1 Tax=Flavobacterium chungangensis TaxID=2708132 RepID=A0ABV8ZEL7_9FLAO
MTDVEINALAIEIYSLTNNENIRNYIRQCIRAGKITKEEIKDCVLFKIAQELKK